MWRARPGARQEARCRGDLGIDVQSSPRISRRPGSATCHRRWGAPPPDHTVRAGLGFVPQSELQDPGWDQHPAVVPAASREGERQRLPSGRVAPRAVRQIRSRAASGQRCAWGAVRASTARHACPRSADRRSPPASESAAGSYRLWRNRHPGRCRLGLTAWLARSDTACNLAAVSTWVGRTHDALAACSKCHNLGRYGFHDHQKKLPGH